MDLLYYCCNGYNVVWYLFSSTRSIYSIDSITGTAAVIGSATALLRHLGCCVVVSRNSWLGACIPRPCALQLFTSVASKHTGRRDATTQHCAPSYSTCLHDRSFPVHPLYIPCRGNILGVLVYYSRVMDATFTAALVRFGFGFTDSICLPT